MRKALSALIVPLVAVALMTAAVSAFEAHTINVTAHVSKSLTVSATNDAIGTQGEPKTPLSWEGNFVPIGVGLSQSFLDQGRVSTVDYRVCAQAKPNTHPGDTSDLEQFEFLWMGGSAFLEMNPPATVTDPFRWIGPSTDITPPTGAVCPSGATGILDSTAPADIINLWWEPPAFAQFFTQDETVKPRDPLAVCGTGQNVKSDTQPCVILTDPPAKSQGTKLGLDLVIQVTNIYTP